MSSFSPGRAVLSPPAPPEGGFPASAISCAEVARLMTILGGGPRYPPSSSFFALASPARGPQLHPTISYIHVVGALLLHSLTRLPCHLTVRLLTVTV